MPELLLLRDWKYNDMGTRRLSLCCHELQQVPVQVNQKILCAVIYPRRFMKISFRSFGLAFPFEAFMAIPIKNPITLGFPFR